MLLAASTLLGCALQRSAAARASHPWPRPGIVVISPPPKETLDQFGPVWYYQYGFGGDDIEGHQRVHLVLPHFSDQRLVSAFRDHPGSWWIVGNEPNDPNQDNLSPGAYAGFYHRVWCIARRSDWTAHLVPAGIANADWQWAQAFRHSYREQYGRYPIVHAWNIHNYILEPEHSQYDVGEFRRRILDFRAWMARIGDEGLPLLLTEYGVLYGSGCCNRPLEDPERGVEFLRQATNWLGQTNHVQAWAWFSLDSRGQFNGDLLTEGEQFTPFGAAYREALLHHFEAGEQRRQ